MWAGASSSHGVTIDMKQLNDLQLSEDLATAFVGAGNRWGGVYNFLDPLNLTVVGGRDTQVGVGGLLLGGRPYCPTGSSACVYVRV